MTLVKETLKNEIKAAFDEVKTYDGTSGKNGDAAIEKLCDTIANSVDKYIKSATVSSSHVITLVAPSGGGPVTGTITTTNSIN